MDLPPPETEIIRISKDTNTTAPKHLYIQFWTCFFVNSKNGTFSTLKRNTFYKCSPHSTYFLNTECTIGDSLVACGYLICVGLTAIILLLGVLGLFSNVLNLLILPKSLNGCSVKRLMLLLSVFDLLASVCAIPAALLMLLILGLYETRYEAMVAFWVFYLLYSLGRTGSIFTTIMIAVERYIAIGFPLKQWLTPKKARIHLLIVLVVVALVNLPWWLNKRVEKNEVFVKSPSSNNSIWNDLTNFPFVYKGTSFARYVYPKFVTYHIFIDFAFPFPVLLILNGLLYRSIYRSNKARQAMTVSERREINAAKTFSIIVIILLLCHTVALVVFICSQVHRINFRELQFCQMMSATLNASINFMIYFALGKSFRDEFWALLYRCNLCRNKIEQRQRANATPSYSSGNRSMELRVTSSVKERSVKKLHLNNNTCQMISTVT